MFFEIFGILFSCLVGAIALVYILTEDVAPTFLKRFLTRVAISNWQKTQPQRIGFYNTEAPKCTADTGIFPCPEEDAIELPKKLESNETDELRFFGIDDSGNGIHVEMVRFHGDLTEAGLLMSLNGVTYSVSRRGINRSGEFSLGNFKLELVESMRCWRIWYNGILRNENTEEDVHGVLNFLWKPFDSPSDTKRNLNFHLLSEFCTKSGPFGSSLTEISKLLPDGYRQFGALHGTIRIEDIEQTVYLYGLRSRQWGSIRPKNEQKIDNSNDQLELFGMTGCNGNIFTLTGTIGGWIDGQTHLPSNKKFQIEDVDVGAEMFSANGVLPKLFTLKDKKCSFLVEIWPKTVTIKLTSTEILLLNISVNGKPGRGFLFRKSQRHFSPSHQLLSSIMDTSIIQAYNIRSIEACPDFQKSDVVPEIVSFKSYHSTDVGLVGGKGASLAQLCHLSQHSKNFNTSKGFCVTTASFKKHLPLDSFRRIFSNPHDLEKTCDIVMKIIVDSSAQNEISALVNSWISEIFGNKENLKLAVRSSGILEDGAQLSCAGQNETFLGVSSMDVASKVVSCWASLFTPQSVRYRLTHGQPAVSEMAVVVQEMVGASVAGVAFTANPVTGNPFQMMVSSNYGLGESVVSASCDPDTTTLLRSGSDSEPVVSEQHLGKKQSKIILSPAGTIEMETSAEEQASYCVSSQVASILGRVAVTIEKALGNLKPVDIEWALDQAGDLYILQCRPITSLDAWTDFELIHEADSPYNTTFERLTHANTGEVMPGVTSPLSLSVILKLLDVGIQLRAKNRLASSDPIVPYAWRKTVASRHRVLLNVLNALYGSVEKEITTSQVAADLSIFGHRVMDEELHALAVERHGVGSMVEKMRELKGLLTTVWETKAEIKRATVAYSRYTIDYQNVQENSAKLYELITQKIFDLYQIANLHCMMSEASTVTQMFALLSLAQGRKADEWDCDIYEDVSKVLAVCMDVESADVPSAMDLLAKTIVLEGGDSETVVNEFVDPSPQIAFKWLTGNSNSLVPQAVEDFFEKHGHRCISELDLMRKSWKSDPIPFVNLLQSLVRNKIKFEGSKTNSAKTNRYRNDEELVSSLHTNLGWIGKSFLKFLLPYCHQAVWNREKTKSHFIRIEDQLKQGYELLAQGMVTEQLLPDKQLIYFMSHHQIGLLLRRDPSSPILLYKAMRKMKLFPQLNKEEYPEITIGIRVPVERKDNVEYGDSLTATPVSSGKVQAVAKVCMTIEEASKLIEPGDILITHGTDIGWSPFFPILGGIVTELGGLISHGAVVAREYGLPCVVGAGNATKIFKTGEVLLLDAGKGTITKVKVNPDS